MKKWWRAFRGLDRISALAEQLTATRAEVENLSRSLHRSQLEADDLQHRLELERIEHEKSKRHITTMWNFIALRHRIDLPAENGSIRKSLQKAEARR